MRTSTEAAAALSLILCLSGPLGAATDRPLKSYPDAELKAAAPNTDVLFVVSGDNRPTAKGAPMPPVLATIISEIGVIRPDFVLWTGDTVYGYCDTREELEQEYRAFEEAARPIAGTVPLYNAPGNHEIHSQQTCKAPAETLCGPPCSEEAFRTRFGQLYGSFDHAGVHYIALDTDFPGAQDAIAGEQLEWLKRDLEANKGARAIFLFSHTEFYSSPHIDEQAGRSHPGVKNAQELHELFRRYPVKAVFSGHEHLYWREAHDGIDYFVAGGAGAPLYASPDRGGFSHYLVVRVTGATVNYDLIEPGRLSLSNGSGGKDEAKVWIVNSNDLTQPLLLRGLDVQVPASLGDCAALTVGGELRRGAEGEPIEGFAIESCAPAPGGNLRLHLKAPPLRQGSVAVTVRKKASGKPG
ncbi:MAG: metallophosphoesterase family protein [Thermoanaerobaculia bacterium]